MLLVVQISADPGEDFPGEVAVVIPRVGFAQYLHRATWSSSGSKLWSSSSRAQGLVMMMACGDTTGLPHQVNMHVGNSPESRANHCRTFFHRFWKEHTCKAQVKLHSVKSKPVLCVSFQPPIVPLTSVSPNASSTQTEDSLKEICLIGTALNPKNLEHLF